MPYSVATALSPMVQKLIQHSAIESAEIQALLALPFLLAKKDRGAHLVRERDKVDQCIVLLSGFIYRSKTAGDGSRQILSIHVRGDIVDLQNCLLNEADHSVQALTSVEIAYIPQRALLAVASALPGVALALWRDTIIDGAKFREWLLNLGQRNARQRICHLICELVCRQEKAGLSKGPRYELPMTQEQIGDATGLTTVHVNRTMQAIKSEKLIATTGRFIDILNWEALKFAGDFAPRYLHHSHDGVNRLIASQGYTDG